MIKEFFRPLLHKKTGGYVVLTLLFSWLIQAFIIYSGGFNTVSIVWIALLMWTPGVIGLLFRLLHNDWADFPLKLGGIGWWLGVILVSALMTGIPFFASWIFGLNGFVVPDFLDSRWFEIGGFWLVIAITIPSRIAIQSLLALGEELGWQGYLVPKLLQNKAKKPFLTQAIIWSLWHTPLLLFGGYAVANGSWIAVSVISYWCMISSLGMMISAVTQKTQSVWLATLFHGSHNFFIQQWWPLWTVFGAWNWLITGEAAAVTAVVFIAFATIILATLNQKTQNTKTVTN